MKVPFFFRSVRCDSGDVATYQRILHFYFRFAVPMLVFPFVLFVPFWSLKSLSQSISVKISLLPFPFVKPALLSKLLFLLPLHA